jgi:hypothetical protein
MKTLFAEVLVAALIASAGCSRTPTTGPNGGDVVAINDGTAKAEVLSNASTGEVIVQTYADDLQTRRPIERLPIAVGSDEHRIELTPHPVDTDAPGTSSRFYGQADWVRGGTIHHGWMEGGNGAGRQEFEWQHGWEAGRTQGRMWEAIGEHRHMGAEHEGGPRGPMNR